jgi:hypothetical protein
MPRRYHPRSALPSFARCSFSLPSTPREDLRGWYGRKVPTVARLNVTPVKSTALHHPRQLRLEPYGAVGNRDFYFVDEHGRLQGGWKFGPYVQIWSEHDPMAEHLSLRFPDGTLIEGPGNALDEPINTSFYGVRSLRICSRGRGRTRSRRSSAVRSGSRGSTTRATGPTAGR